MDLKDQQLERYGWNDFFAAHFGEFAAQGHVAGRIALEYNQFCRVYTARGEMLAEIAGRLRRRAESRADLPAVGDWVALRLVESGNKAVIHAVLPRSSKFMRKTKGVKTEEQVVGANIDTLFLVTSLNQDFNPRRIERYLTVAWESGASPVILLTKTDLCDDVETKIKEAEEVAPGRRFTRSARFMVRGVREAKGLRPSINIFSQARLSRWSGRRAWANRP